MSVKRQDLIDYLKSNGFNILREGGKDSIYTLMLVKNALAIPAIHVPLARNSVCARMTIPRRLGRGFQLIGTPLALDEDFRPYSV